MWSALMDPTVGVFPREETMSDEPRPSPIPISMCSKNKDKNKLCGLQSASETNQVKEISF
jgi:hypothetical protein